MLHDFQARRSVSLRELQSLIGLWSFTCLVVVRGRAFIRRIIDLTKGVKKLHHHIHLSRGARFSLATSGKRPSLSGYICITYINFYPELCTFPIFFVRTLLVLIFWSRMAERARTHVFLLLQ